MNLRCCALMAALAATACSKSTSAPPAATPPAPPATLAAVATPAFDDSVRSASGTSAPTCMVKPQRSGAPLAMKIAGRNARRTGTTLSFLDANPDARSVFGVLASVNEATDENLRTLRQYVDFFKSEKVEAIVFAGDVGESREGIERVLSLLGATGLPVLVAIGNRECREDFNAALTEVRRSHPNIVNLGEIRHVEFDGADLVSLPGYHDPRYIHCETGCQYYKEDLEALTPVVRGAKSPVILVTHGPPLGTAATAIDHATQVGNVGDANLTEFLEQARIPFGIFANIKEAGGRATDLSGATIIPEDTLSERLFLNPGPADSTSWAMNDETRSTGMAAVLSIEGGRGRYRIFRASRPAR